MDVLLLASNNFVYVEYNFVYVDFVDNDLVIGN